GAGGSSEVTVLRGPAQDLVVGVEDDVGDGKAGRDRRARSRSGDLDHARRALSMAASCLDREMGAVARLLLGDDGANTGLFRVPGQLEVGGAGAMEPLVEEPVELPARALPARVEEGLPGHRLRMPAPGEAGQDLLESLATDLPREHVEDERALVV